MACGLITVCNLVDDDKSFIPRVILTYRPFEGATTYASFSTGSLLGVQTQAGFISSVAPTVIPDPTQFGIFTPTQKNTTYEIGWKQKADWWSFALSGYFTKWENQPFASVVVLPVGSSSFRGPGSSETWGVELEGAADVLPVARHGGDHDPQLRQPVGVLERLSPALRAELDVELQPDHPWRRERPQRVPARGRAV